ncbi:Flp pilus assembly complex ATPase component TadA [Spongiibacter sp. KMU-158]|uniref:Flp pilus assembly complex ATPase component TadA n=1 Tax=Spongiibacter pelagi TaxID=2760804 RepID=A0A927GV29_9GAMM|nr:ATPase, T2SS/T4P/T4SS family [Spongiibacter pelagi]MBD2858241.1 Flp pilus assembly complex ATPase component TadA [Spongiibacter pelagi]
MTENSKAHADRISSALTKVERHAFIKNEHADLVAGNSIPPKDGLRRMLDITHFGPEAKALHIGAGSGYVTAVLSQLSHKVIAFEINKTLSEAASQLLKTQGYENIEIRNLDGSRGAPEDAPFDLIIVSTPAIHDKTPLLKQLNNFGELICLESGEASKQILVRYTKQINNHILRSEHGYIDFHPYKEEMLVELGIIEPNTLAEARKQAKANGSLIIDEIRKLQNLDEQKLYKSLAKQHSIPLETVSSIGKKLNLTLFDKFSKAFLDHQHVLPVYIDDLSLHVATSNPSASMQEIQAMFPRHKIAKILVTPTDFQRLWSTLDRSMGEKGIQSSRIEQQSPGYDQDLLDNSHIIDESRPIALWEALLLDAVADKASDIHLEKYGDKIRVRLRIDGSLQDLSHYHISPAEFLGLVNVIKLRGDMNIAERRLPQGGRSQIRMGEQHFDLRIQIQPSLHGEHIVVRLLPQNSQLISIDALGMPKIIANQYKRLLQNPAGLVLVVGPTGSGKSTTLYAGLQLMAEDTSRKVITVEDPIEYSIQNIQQTRVRPGIGFTFADAMRSFVRQDPDVIMVGEIRDHETALEALRASQTGHIVLSTLHCNDSVDAVQRLFDLDVHPNSLASELLAVIAQRLAKKICPQCKTQVDPDPNIVNELFPVAVPDNFVCFEGKGCEHCNGTGTKGRIGVIEYLHLNPDLRVSISKRIPIGELRSQALDSGLTTMRDSALDHVIQGTIPLSELPRILPQERMAPEKRGQWKA